MTMVGVMHEEGTAGKPVVDSWLYHFADKECCLSRLIYMITSHWHLDPTTHGELLDGACLHLRMRSDGSPDTDTVRLCACPDQEPV